MKNRFLPTLLFALMLIASIAFANSLHTVLRYKETFVDQHAMAEVVKSAAAGLAAFCIGKPEDEQIRVITDFVDAVRFLEDETGYFYVYNFDGVNIAHAIQKDLINRDLIDYRDSNGRFVIRELSDTARQGGGFVHFRWQRPDGTPDNSKLGYVAPIQNTDFFIGSGIYVPEHHWIVAFAYAKPPFVFATPPFSTRDYNVYGEPASVELTLFREALAAVGHTFTPVFYSYDELEAGLQDGTIEIAATVRNTLPDIHYSQEFVYFHNVAVTKRRNNLSIETLADLAGKSIVTWEGASKDLGPEFHAAVADNDAYFEIGNQAEQGAYFFDDKADVIIIDKTIFQWWLTEFADTHNTTDEYVYHDLFPDKTIFCVGFQSEEQRDLFERGLSIIRENGTYRNILDF